MSSLKTLAYLEELLVSMVGLGLLSRMLRFSVWVGVTTVVIPPVQLPVSNLKKLGFFWVGAGAAGTTNPSGPW